MAFIKKLSRPTEAALTGQAAHDPSLQAEYPALHEHLTQHVDGEGGKRQTCSLTVFGAQGSFRAFLNDRDSGASICVDDQSLEGILAALEAELESDSPRWVWKDRPRGSSSQKQGRKP